MSISKTSEVNCKSFPGTYGLISSKLMKGVPIRRTSHHSCSIKKPALGNFAKFIGKHLCQSLFFNKVADLSPATLFFLKKILAQVFSCEFNKIFKNTFFTEHIRASVQIQEGKKWRRHVDCSTFRINKSQSHYHGRLAVCTALVCRTK